MTARRKLLLALGAVGALAALPVLAQQEKRARRIGYFSGGNLQSSAAWLAAFREGMTSLRWVEKRDYVIDARYGNGVVKAFDGLAAELVATQPDLLLASGDTVARLLAQKTKTIPIVFAIAQGPVEIGLAASLQRPGGNATGLTTLAQELGAKKLQLLKEAFPRVAHVVVLFDPGVRGSALQAKEAEGAAASLGVRVTAIELVQLADIEAAFKRGAELGVHAYVVTDSALVAAQLPAIADRIMRAKVPAICAFNHFADIGGLMSYGASYTDNFRRSAAYVDKILKGAKPGELPIEQPTVFELAVNLKTAKAMGLRFPQSFLVRANRLIE